MAYHLARQLPGNLKMKELTAGPNRDPVAGTELCRIKDVPRDLEIGEAMGRARRKEGGERWGSPKWRGC